MNRFIPLLRAEGLFVLAAAIALYAHLGGGWLFFVLLLLAPDLGMLGYLVGPRVGAAAYNAVHVYGGPVLVGLVGLYLASTLAVQLALIWTAHIGLDRMLGYGLKSPDGFKVTHLGTLGAP